MRAKGGHEAAMASVFNFDRFSVLRGSDDCQRTGGAAQGYDTGQLNPWDNVGMKTSHWIAPPSLLPPPPTTTTNIPSSLAEWNLSNRRATSDTDLTPNRSRGKETVAQGSDWRDPFLAIVWKKKKLSQNLCAWATEEKRGSPWFRLGKMYCLAISEGKLSRESFQCLRMKHQYHLLYVESFNAIFS